MLAGIILALFALFLIISTLAPNSWKPLICISIGLTIDNLIMYFTIENSDVKMLEI